MGNQTSYPLHEAVESGNLEVLTTLLDNGGDINVENNKGETLLHVAVEKNNHLSQELVTLLLERGANPDTKRFYPLHCALRNETVLKALLNNGAFIERKDNRGRTALHLAFQMMDHSSFPVHICNLYYNAANQLLIHGADANSKDNYGRTPLHITDDIECVRLLLDKGALVNSRDNTGKTPLHEAICVSYNVANELLMQGADVNSKDDNGDTPLHITDDIECVRLLLDKGALVNSRNSIGKTPLHEAVSIYYDIANELLMHGADVNSKDDNGDTPLHTAYYVKCVRLLLDKGALVNSPNSFGKTPLHMLSMYERNKAYELLLHGADVNSKDNYGNTPLHTACVNERDLLMEFNRHLLGVTILDYLENTKKTTYFHVANILLDWGASLTTKDNRGRTPFDIFPDLLDWAKPHNVRKSCVKLLDIPCEDFDLKSYWNYCLEEAARLKLVRFGNNSLYDIFGLYSDPIFLSNELLKKAVDMNNYKKEFPIYCYLLQSTYKLAEKRSRMLEDAADTLQTPLPREITWYILTLVDDDSLRNVIKA